MSDIRYNQWLHNSGTGGVSQDAGGNIGIGTTAPLIPVGAGNTTILNVGVVTCNSIKVTGNVSVGGTLTYQDVTNIDSVGIVTARTSVYVGADVAHLGDTDTKIAFTDNQIDLQTNGTERLRINSDGDILLGTDQATIGCVTADGSDNRSFNLCGGSDASQSRGAVVTIYGNEANNGSSEYGVLSLKSGNTSTGSINFWTQGTERLRITSTGKFGFGGVTPGGNPAGKAVFLAIGDSDTGIVQDGDGQLELWANNNEVANINAIDGYTSTKLITTSNNMTMGGRLTHHGDTDTYMEYTDNQINFVTGGSSRMYANNYAVYVQSGLPLAFLATSGATPNIKSGGTNNQDLLFTTGSGNPTRLQIKSNGNVLIGTSTDGFASYGDTLTIENSNHVGLTLRTATNKDAAIYFADSSSGGGRYAGSINYNHSNNYLSFTTNESERLRIDSNGKIGINDTSPSAYLDIAQGGIDSNVPGINIAMTGVGGGTAGEQYGLKITGGGYNNATHIYGIYVDKTAQLTQQNTAAHHKMTGTYSTLYGTQSIVQCSDTGATGTVYGTYSSARGNSGSAKNKTGYGIWAESTGTNFQLACATYLKTVAGATLIYGIIYNHAGSEKFRVDGAGSVYSATNSYSSDRDLKDNIVNLSGTSLDKIKQLTPRRFTWKLNDKVKESGTLTGLIAQEVQPILPDIVTGTDGKEDMGINYNGLVAHLVNAVKELSAENEAMRARLDALESS
tara:strand:+ start:1542 stop:3737 length:2196 start_codon:yes stop_codon:yes gene_type:complete